MVVITKKQYKKIKQIQEALMPLEIDLNLIKENGVNIDALKAEIKALKAENDSLKQDMKMLKEDMNECKKIVHKLGANVSNNDELVKELEDFINNTEVVK